MKFVVKTSFITKEFESYSEARRFYQSKKTWTKGPVSLIAIDGELKYVFDETAGGFIPLNY